jgi:hypothetical protein
MVTGHGGINCRDLRECPSTAEELDLTRAQTYLDNNNELDERGSVVKDQPRECQSTASFALADGRSQIEAWSRKPF